MGQHGDGQPRAFSVRVITVSDRSHAGEREDLSGPMAVALLTDAGHSATTQIIPDGADSVHAALRDALRHGHRLVITSGGTGVSARDLTPEGTAPVLDQELPGVADLLRRAGAEQSPFAVLGRGLAGVVRASDRPPAVVVNLPGSPRAVRQGVELLLPLLDHLFAQLDGSDH